LLRGSPRHTMTKPRKAVATIESMSTRKTKRQVLLIIFWGFVIKIGGIYRWYLVFHSLVALRMCWTGKLANRNAVALGPAIWCASPAYSRRASELLRWRISQQTDFKTQETRSTYVYTRIEVIVGRRCEETAQRLGECEQKEVRELERSQHEEHERDGRVQMAT
jgi:hypothetical protein